MLSGGLGFFTEVVMFIFESFSVQILYIFFIYSYLLDGMSERNHCHIIIFSFHCFNGFSVASWRIMQHVIEKPLPYN